MESRQINKHSLRTSAQANLNALEDKADNINLWLKPSSFQSSSVAQSCLTPCNPMDCTMLGLPVHHQLLEFTQTHVH